MKKRFFMRSFLFGCKHKLIAFPSIIFLFVSCSSQLSKKSQSVQEYESVVEISQWYAGPEPRVLTAAISLENLESPLSMVTSIKVNQRGTDVLAANFKSINREYWYEIKGKTLYLFWNSNGNQSQRTQVKIKIRKENN